LKFFEFLDFYFLKITVQAVLNKIKNKKKLYDSQLAALAVHFFSSLPFCFFFLLATIADILPSDFFVFFF
jgi:hypothetical protein